MNIEEQLQTRFALHFPIIFQVQRLLSSYIFYGQSQSTNPQLWSFKLKYFITKLHKEMSKECKAKNYRWYLCNFVLYQHNIH